MKTYKIETRNTPIGEVDYHLIKAAGSTMESEDGFVEINYCSNCGDIYAGISIGHVVFNAEDILEIAKNIRKFRQKRGERK